MAQYLSKDTILSLYKDLSDLDPSHKQGATQLVSSIRYFVALDRFFEIKGTDCDVKNRADKELYNQLFIQETKQREREYINRLEQ